MVTFHNLTVNIVQEKNSDLAIVNAARVSFAKESAWDHISQTEIGDFPELKLKDKRLINYLITHKHWSPVAHCNESYFITINDYDLLQFMINVNLAGFNVVKLNNHEGIFIKGSLWAWGENIKHMPKNIAHDIANDLLQKYPHTATVLQLTQYINEGIGDKTLDTIPLTFLSDDYLFKFRSEDYLANDIKQLARLTTETIHIKVPVFMARQLVKHQQGLVWNEISRRYVDSPPEFYFPDEYRAAPEKDPITGRINNKQGSSHNKLSILNIPNLGKKSTPINVLLIDKLYSRLGTTLYNLKLRSGFSAEVARSSLPVNYYTESYWTGSIYDFYRVYSLRSDAHSQYDSQWFAEALNHVMSHKWPYLWNFLKRE